MHGLDEATFKRYKRLALHFTINKVDPLKLDDFKYAFLQQAETDLVSVTVTKLR